MTFTSGRGGRCIGVKLARIEPKAKVSLAATKGIQQGISMTSQHFCNIFPEKFNLKLRSSVAASRFMSDIRWCFYRAGG
jgi:hypothetical protein